MGLIYITLLGMCAKQSAYSRTGSVWAHLSLCPMSQAHVGLGQYGPGPDGMGLGPLLYRSKYVVLIEN